MLIAAHVELRHPGHSPQSVHAGKHGGLMKGMQEPDGGFTVDRDGKPITTGWSVGIEGSTTGVMASEITTNRPKVRAALVDKMRTIPDDADGIGGWHEPATGIVHIDHVKVFPSDQHDAAKKFAQDNNQISMANLDAIAKGDWGNAIEDVGGTGDLRSASLRSHAAAVDVQVLEAPVGDDRRGARRAGRPDPRQVGRRDRRRVGAAFAHVELRHPGHEDQKVHGKWASGRVSPVHGELKSGSVNANLSVGALNDETIGANKDGTWADGTGVGDASVARLQESGGVTPEQAAENLDRLAEEAFARAGGPPLPGETWYEEGGQHARDHAREMGLDEEVGIGMTAAQSPMTEWSQNQVNADVAMDAVSRKGEPIPDDALAYLTGTKHGRKALEKDGVELADGETLESLYAKSPRAAGIAASQYGSSMAPERMARLGLTPPIKTTMSAGAPPWETTVRIGMSNDPAAVDGLLNGPKVRSFRNNLSDPKNSEDVTIDTHMQRAATNTPGSRDENWRSVKRDSTKMTSSPSYPGGADVGAHAALADATRTATDRFNARHGTSYTPSQFQAVVWTEQLRQYPRERVQRVLSGAEPEVMLGGPDRWGNQYGSGVITGVTET